MRRRVDRNSAELLAALRAVPVGTQPQPSALPDLLPPPVLAAMAALPRQSPPSGGDT
jgi:hypothetical protein